MTDLIRVVRLGPINQSETNCMDQLGLDGHDIPSLPFIVY